MDLFTVIDDGVAIVRMPKGVHKQTKIYRRGDNVYVPHSGGFIRIAGRFGDAFTTGHPDIKVMEIEAPGFVERSGALKPTARMAVAA